MIYGNIDGIKNHYLIELEEIYNLKLGSGEILNDKLLNAICNSTSKLNREVSVAIDRKGNVKFVSVGDSTSVDMPLIDIRERRLSGIKIIHTHPNGISSLSALDISALIKMKLDCIAAVSVEEEKEPRASIGFCDIKDGILSADIIDDIEISALTNININEKVQITENLMSKNEIVEDMSERAILVGCDSEESLDELQELALACGVEVATKVFQKRNKIDTTFYIGSGKAKEIAMLSQAIRANMIIFDDELSGSQVRNLEDITGIKVIDRTILILDIFAKRAKSKEAKIQVELAQLKYRLPRLTGLGTILSRTGGGIGTRGPGEKKLEIDRRHIRETIYDLNKELEKIQKVREVQREKRSKDNIPKVALVGYTNVGKSTLRNRLCEIALPKENTVKEKVFEADMLFATLDTTTRALLLQDNRLITLTDTVGFVRKLPHELVEAFKSTLEEVIFSDLLVHVVDAASPELKSQIDAVENVLNELDAFKLPKILVLNKIDCIDEEYLKAIIDEYTKNNNYMDIISISAKFGTNLDLLLQVISKHLPQKLKSAEFLIPYGDTSVAAYLHRNSNILLEEYRDDGVYLKVELDDEAYNKCIKFLVEK